MNQIEAPQLLTLRLRDGSEKTVLNPYLLPIPPKPQSRRKRAGRLQGSAKKTGNSGKLPDLHVVRPPYPWLGLAYAKEFTDLILNSREPFAASADFVLAMQNVQVQRNDSAKILLPRPDALLLERNARVRDWLEKVTLPHDISLEPGFGSGCTQAQNGRSWAEVATGWSGASLKNSSSSPAAMNSGAEQKTSRSKLDTSFKLGMVVAHDHVIEQSKNSLKESNQLSQKKILIAKTNTLPFAKHHDLSAGKPKRGFLAAPQRPNRKAFSKLESLNSEPLMHHDNSSHKSLSQETILHKKSGSFGLSRPEQETQKQPSSLNKVSRKEKDKCEILDSRSSSVPGVEPKANIDKRLQKRFVYGQKWRAEGIKRDLDNNWRVRD